MKWIRLAYDSETSGLMEDEKFISSISNKWFLNRNSNPWSYMYHSYE
jgi:hypothetical protein